MKNTDELIAAMKSMTTEERIAALRAARPELFTVKPQVVSFGKEPKGGFTDADEVAK